MENQMILNADFEDIDERLIAFIQSGRKKVLYGAGRQARVCWDIIRAFGSNVEYLIAKECCDQQFREGMLIKDIDSVSDEDKENCDILIAVNEKFNDEIKHLLTKNGFLHIYWSNNWIRANEQLRFIFLEKYLKNKLGSYDINDDLIKFKDFKIVGCHRQPAGYTSMLTGEFNDIIAPSIFQDYSCLTEGPYEWGKIKINEDDVILDLGANIGMFSCVAASKGAQVYAFEPTPSTIELLKMNQALYERFYIVPYAVCSQIGKANFYCSPESNAGSDIGSNSLRQELLDSKVIEVNTITIDAFVKQERLERVDFIKADIEGAEREMLKGAQDTLAKFAPKLALCTYHLPDDKEGMERLILDANPNYVIEHRWKKLYAYVPR